MNSQGRYILTQPRLTNFQEVADALKAEYPGLPIPTPDPQPQPGKLMYDISTVSPMPPAVWGFVPCDLLPSHTTSHADG